MDKWITLSSSIVFSLNYEPQKDFLNDEAILIKSAIDRCAYYDLSAVAFVGIGPRA